MQEEGYSPLAKIFRLEAYKQAWSHCGSVTLEGKQHSVVFLHSRAASLRALRLYAAYRQSRYLAWRADKINLSRNRNNYRKQYRERQYPTPRLRESQKGVRILSLRGVFTIGEDTHTLHLKSELFDLRVGYANPILQHFVAEVGSRPLVLRDKNKHHLQGMVFVFMAQEEGYG